MRIKLKHWSKLLTIDYYLFREMFFNFLLYTGLTLFVLLMFQGLRLAEFFIVHNVSGILLIKLGLFMSLLLLPFVLPIAILIAMLMTFRRLSIHHEIIAIKACGMSLSRLALPALSLAMLISILLVTLNLSWIPWGERAFKKTEVRIGNTKIVSVIQPGAFTTGFFDLLIFADKVDPKNNQLEKVFLVDERDPKNPFIYIAKFAKTTSIKTSSEFDLALLLSLHEGNLHHHNLDTNLYEKIDFKTYDLYLKIHAGTDNYLKKPQMIPQKKLLQLIQSYAYNTEKGREFRGEYWRRYATAITPFFFVLLGIGFGTIHQRTTKINAALTGILILCAYWTLQMIFMSLLQSGKLNPFLAMQLPNILLLILGVFRFKHASW